MALLRGGSALTLDFRLHSRLFGNTLARSSEFGRNILELRQSIAQRQNRLGVIDVRPGLNGNVGTVAAYTSTSPSRGW